jgi:hypothetical protein
MKALHPDWYRNWPVHNIIAHPVGEVLKWVGREDLSWWLHDATLPGETEDQ